MNKVIRDLAEYEWRLGGGTNSKSKSKSNFIAAIN